MWEAVRLTESTMRNSIEHVFISGNYKINIFNLHNSYCCDGEWVRRDNDVTIRQYVPMAYRVNPCYVYSVQKRKMYLEQRHKDRFSWALEFFGGAYRHTAFIPFCYFEYFAGNKNGFVHSNWICVFLLGFIAWNESKCVQSIWHTQTNLAQRRSSCRTTWCIQCNNHGLRQYSIWIQLNS